MAELYASKSRFDNINRKARIAFLRYNGGNVGGIGKTRLSWLYSFCMRREIEYQLPGFSVELAFNFETMARHRMPTSGKFEMIPTPENEPSSFRRFLHS